MKRKILSVLGVLMAVLIFCGCSNLSTASGNLSTDGAQSSGGSGESVSTEQGGEENIGESNEKGEHEFRLAAGKMGYSDEQIDEIIEYGNVTLKQLLTPEENDSTDIEVKTSPDGSYAFGGYWYFDGGARLGCVYLKNLSTGKITVLNERLTGYSCYGFTADGSIYFFDYALSAENRSILNFYSPENVRLPYDSWSPDGNGALIWNRVDYIASEDALLTFWVNVDEDFSPDGNTVYPQYEYCTALIHCGDLSVEEQSTGIQLRTNKYGQIVTPELDRRDSSEKKVVLIDDEYQIDFSPLEITPQARRSLS